MHTLRLHCSNVIGFSWASSILFHCMYERATESAGWQSDESFQFSRQISVQGLLVRPPGEDHFRSSNPHVDRVLCIADLFQLAHRPEDKALSIGGKLHSHSLTQPSFDRLPAQMCLTAHNMKAERRGKMVIPGGPIFQGQRLTSSRDRRPCRTESTCDSAKIVCDGPLQPSSPLHNDGEGPDLDVVVCKAREIYG